VLPDRILARLLRFPNVLVAARQPFLTGKEPAVRAKWVLFTMVLGVFLGAGAYTAYFAEGAAYLSNDPRACVNCHVMREHYDGWQKASHHAVATCNDCHVPQELVPKYLAKARNGYFHSKAFTLQDFPEPIRIHPFNAAVLRDNCLRCHGDFVSEIAQHGDGARSDCVRCHQTVGHGPTR
jgi:cytochrome c nitrite reductase small subunit